MLDGGRHANLMLMLIPRWMSAIAHTRPCTHTGNAATSQQVPAAKIRSLARIICAGRTRGSTRWWNCTTSASGVSILLPSDGVRNRRQMRYLIVLASASPHEIPARQIMCVQTCGFWKSELLARVLSLLEFHSTNFTRAAAAVVSLQWWHYQRRETSPDAQINSQYPLSHTIAK